MQAKFMKVGTGRKDTNTYSTSFRDYLLNRLLLDSAWRTGAVPNLTVSEFESGKSEITAKRRLMTFTTRQYKTHGGGPVSLFWDEDVRKMAMLYFVHREQRGKPFFLNFTSMDRQTSGSEVNGHGKAALRTNCCQSVWEENPSHSQVNTPT